MVEPDPDAPTVGASLDKSEAHLGDKLILTVSAVSKGGIAVRLPNKIDLGKLEILDRDDGDRLGRDLGDGRRSYRFILGVAAYEVGELEVPPIELSYNNTRGEVRTIQTLPISLKIKPLVEEATAEKPELQNLRPTRSALVEDRRVMNVVKYAGIALGGALAALIVFLLVRRMRRKEQVAAEVVPLGSVRPPDEVALERLAAIRARGNFSVDGYRPFYFEVAEVVRAFLGACWAFDSLELTTTELLEEMSKHAPERVLEGGDIQKFMADTDLVKFAKAGSTDGDALLILDAAEAIVRGTQRVTVMPNEASGAA